MIVARREWHKQTKVELMRGDPLMARGRFHILLEGLCAARLTARTRSVCSNASRVARRRAVVASPSGYSS